MTESQSSAPPRRAAFIFVFITVLLDMLALGIIVPVLPKLVVDFLSGDTARAAEIYGIFGTVGALMQFLFSPLHGVLSDRFGRRPLILFSNFGLGLDYVLMALAPNLWWLFAGRVVSGICAASISTSYAYIAGVTPPDLRAGRFGFIGVSFGAGFVLGPALAGLAGTVDPRAAVLDRGGTEPRQCTLRPLHPAGVAAEGPTCTLRLEECKSSGLAGVAAIASGAHGARGSELPREPRACEPAEH